MDRRHLWSQDGVARFLHLLGVANLLVSCRFCLAVHGCTARRTSASGLFQRAVSHANALWNSLGNQAGSCKSLELCLLLVQGSHQRADTNASSAQVGDLVNLEHSVNLARSLKNLLDLVGGQRVKAATKREELNEVQVVSGRNKASRTVQTRVIHPLVNNTDGALRHHLMSNGILGENSKTKRRNQLRNSVINLWVVVVWATCKNNTVSVVLLNPRKSLVTCAVHLVLDVDVFLPSSLNSGVNFGARDVLAAEATLAYLGVLLALFADELVQTTLELVLLVIRNERSHVLDGRIGELVHVEAQRLRIAHDNWAVVVVGCGVVLLALPTNAWHPNEVWVLGQQIHDVAVRKLCRIAGGLGRHGLNAHIVRLCGGLIGQNDREAQLSEKRVPERIVLVHVQRARNANSAAWSLIFRKRLAIKQQLVLERKDVWCFVLLSTTLLTCAFLATVTGDKPVAAAKVVDGKHAAVRADAAVRVGKFDLQVVDGLAV